MRKIKDSGTLPLPMLWKIDCNYLVNALDSKILSWVPKALTMFSLDSMRLKMSVFYSYPIFPLFYTLNNSIQCTTNMSVAEAN